VDWHGPHHIAVVVVVAERSAPSAAGRGEVIRVTSPIAELRLAREKKSRGSRMERSPDNAPKGAESR